MAILFTTIAAAAVWIVLLSLDIKSLDALLVAGAIVFVAAATKMIAPSLPGNRRPERPTDRYTPR